MSAAAGHGRACGTFGELLQGVLPGSKAFLVTLPIDRGARACFAPAPDLSGVVVAPADKRKAAELARLLLEALGLPPGGRLSLGSDLPEGKGMASSSADLVAAARAIADAYGRELDEALLLDCMRRIEPSDGVMYTGAVLFFHRAVRLGARLGPLPPLAIVGLDEGGAVDTLAFNALTLPPGPARQAEYARLLDELRAAIPAGDAAAIGRVATHSALLHQEAHPKRTLDRLLALCDEAGGLGVAVAHSGTVAGVLLDAARPEHTDQIALLRHRMRPLSRQVAVFSTTGACAPAQDRPEIEER